MDRYLVIGRLLKIDIFIIKIHKYVFTAYFLIVVLVLLYNVVLLYDCDLS